MVDFCITAVRYDGDNNQIDFVEVREIKKGKEGVKIGSPRIVSRAFVADLIRLNKATFETRTLTPEKKWRKGAKVIRLEENFLTTENNGIERDNLENLPDIKPTLLPRR